MKKLILLLSIVLPSIGLSQNIVGALGSIATNHPNYTNYFIPGTTIFIDRAATFQSTAIVDKFLTFTQDCDVVGISPEPYSGYMRLTGLSTINNKSICIVSLLNNRGTGPIGPWTAAEAKHFGLSIFATNADNNYILMISPAASALGERSLQLVKQVLGVETILDTEVVLGLTLGTQYRMELDRLGAGGTLLTGVLKDIDGNVLGTVSATDTSLSSGQTGGHGFSSKYTISQVIIQFVLAPWFVWRGRKKSKGRFIVDTFKQAA
jgi:hypothetical protein